MKIVVLGGGNGTSRLLRALLPLLREAAPKGGEPRPSDGREKIESLHALVSTADDGGSTGQLRAQYGVGSMGDLTKSLMALSSLQGDIRGEELLRALNYRFHEGDFAGHTLRNILLAVFELTSQDIDSAIAILARLLQIPKASGVVPTTLKALAQQVEVTIDGQRSILGEGQHFISHKVNLQIDPKWKPGDVRVSFKEELPLNPRAAQLLQGATHILVAPGHTFGTILPTLALPALGEAVKKSQAKLWVVMTLLSTPHQTTGWSGEDFVRVYENYLGRPVELVISNTSHVDVPLVPEQHWVEFKEKEHNYKFMQADVVSTEEQPAQAADVVPRAIVVHDHTKLEKLFRELLK